MHGCYVFCAVATRQKIVIVRRNRHKMMSLRGP